MKTDETLAYDVTQEHMGAQWRVTGSYAGAENIHVFRDGEQVASFTVPGYTIWNYVAHLGDMARDLTAQAIGA